MSNKEKEIILKEISTHIWLTINAYAAFKKIGKSGLIELNKKYSQYNMERAGLESILFLAKRLKIKWIDIIKTDANNEKYLQNIDITEQWYNY